MRNLASIRTLIPAVIFGVMAVVPAIVEGEHDNRWRATQHTEAQHETAPTGAGPHRNPPAKLLGDIEPLSIRRIPEPPVSTWSQIRRASAQRSPHGRDWPPLQTAGYLQESDDVLPAPAGIESSPPEIPCDICAEEHSWQILPDGLLFKSYMAGVKESRLSTATLYSIGGDTFQESTLGGRVGILRNGTPGAIRPEGWQLDFEGAAFLRQNWSEELDVDAVDFRYGVPLTWRRGPWAAKFSFYHLSSHVGDEFLIRNPGFRRLNYLRDSLITAVSYDVTSDWRVYGEAGYAVHTDGGAEPWEFQFGAEYSPVIRNGSHGSPFFAVNANLRQEVNFGGGINLMFGWQWRSRVNDRIFRIGGQYYNGNSMQFSFFKQHEQLIGFGVWYDF